MGLRRKPLEVVDEASPAVLRILVVHADVNGFLAAVKPDWERSQTRLDDTPAAVATFVRTRDGTPSRDFVLNPATLNDVYGYAVSVMDPFNRGSGKAPFTRRG